MQASLPILYPTGLCVPINIESLSLTLSYNSIPKSKVDFSGVLACLSVYQPVSRGLHRLYPTVKSTDNSQHFSATSFLAHTGDRRLRLRLDSNRRLTYGLQLLLRGGLWVPSRSPSCRGVHAETSFTAPSSTSPVRSCIRVRSLWWIGSLHLPQQDNRKRPFIHTLSFTPSQLIPVIDLLRHRRASGIWNDCVDSMNRVHMWSPVGHKPQDAKVVEEVVEVCWKTYSNRT